jgi:D-alanyl-D-alanine carboxypeptidase
MILIIFSQSHRALRVMINEINQSLQYELDKLRQKLRFPGATCAYVLSDGILGEAASGVADKETNEPMTIGSRMLAASIGKTFVGATIISMAKDGLINLDGPLSEYIGDRHWFTRLANHKTITLRNLLTHSSGLPDHVHSQKFLQNPYFKKLQAGDSFSPEALIDCILDQPALFETGQGWSYTDTGYILLGLVIETVSGEDYFKIVNQKFLKPLKLDMTTPSDRPNPSGLIAGYTTPDNAFGLPIKTLNQSGLMAWNPILEWTGGGFMSTSSNLAVWIKLLCEGKVMQSAYLENLFHSVPIGDTGSDMKYGAGIVIQQSAFGDKYGHKGVVPGYVSSAHYYSQYGLAIAFQVNTDENASELINVIEKSLVEFVLNKSI